MPLPYKRVTYEVVIDYGSDFQEEGVDERPMFEDIIYGFMLAFLHRHKLNGFKMTKTSEVYPKG